MKFTGCVNNIYPDWFPKFQRSILNGFEMAKFYINGYGTIFPSKSINQNLPFHWSFCILLFIFHFLNCQYHLLYSTYNSDTKMHVSKCTISLIFLRFHFDFQIIFVIFYIPHIVLAQQMHIQELTMSVCFQYCFLLLIFRLSLSFFIFKMHASDFIFSMIFFSLFLSHCMYQNLPFI